MLSIRGMDLGTFYRAAWTGLKSIRRPQCVFICIADHFEPDWKGAGRAQQVERVQRWERDYANLFSSYADSRGRTPQHTFFYPIEVYDEEHVERLSRIVRAGHGDVEVHLHHNNDCSSKLSDLLERSRNTLHERHGLLSRDRSGQIRYGFIHGNWALDNSHPDGAWCGVNDEISVLKKTGCYADFTMPAAPHPAQTKTINSIYYAIDDPLRPKSHDRGVAAAVGKRPHPDGLLMIQGPTSVKIEFMSPVPRFRLENGNLAGSQPPSKQRLLNWIQASVCVQGRPEWVFVKLHTHGAQESNMGVLLGQPMCQMHAALRELSNELDFQYYYVTSREMAQIIEQAESGKKAVCFDQLDWK